LLLATKHLAKSAGEHHTRTPILIDAMAILGGLHVAAVQRLLCATD